MRAAAASGQSDVFLYDQLPPFLRKQIARIFSEVIGHYYEATGYGTRTPPNANHIWDVLASIMAMECEAFHDQDIGIPNKQLLCRAFLLDHSNPYDCLSLIELGCRTIQRLADKGGGFDRAPERRGAQKSAVGAIDEINERFLENSVGYRFEDGMIIRVDEEFVHAEVTKPALRLLSAPFFVKANEDFREAHKHYREGDYKSCNTAALRCVESTLKAICDDLGWIYQPSHRAAELVKLVVKEGLFPNYLDNGLTAYVAMMKTGVPGVRNSAGAHGSSSTEPSPPRYLSGYALHMTAANVVMLAEARGALAT